MSKIEREISNNYKALIIAEQRRMIRDRGGDDNIEPWEREMIYTEAIVNINSIITTMLIDRRSRNK